MFRAKALGLIVLVLVCGIAETADAVINIGDVLAGVGTGKIKQFSPTGTLLATFDSTTASSETTGMCFDSSGNLYATMFQTGQISKFDPNGVLVNASFISGLSNPESCQWNKAGELFVGLAGAAQIQKFNSAGTPLATFATSSTTGWIDIAADQCTIFYADDSSAISRFNICTNTQLPTFATMSNVASGLRILPNGDVLASNRTGVSRFDSSGTLLGNYSAPAGNSLIFAVTLDPDGVTFWTADLSNGNIFRYNLTPINSTPVTQFNSAQFVDTAGIVIKGEITVGGGGPGPQTVPTLSEWGMILLALSLLTLGTWQMTGRPSLLGVATTAGGALLRIPAQPLVRSVLVGELVAALGLSLYGGLITPVARHDVLGVGLAGMLLGAMIECYRRGRER